MKITDEKIALLGLLLLGGWIFIFLPLYYLPSTGAETVLGIGSLGWSAISALANIAYDLLTAGILWFAASQIISARREAQTNRTLAACDRYDTDPVLDAVARRLSDAHESGLLKAEPHKHRIDLYSLFNYFESIAIGVNRGLYDESIVRDHMEQIISGYVVDFILSDIAGRKKNSAGKGEEEYFINLMVLHRKWQTAK
jgi:hypothetical protein